MVGDIVLRNRRDPAFLKKLEQGDKSFRFLPRCLLALWADASPHATKEFFHHRSASFSLRFLLDGIRQIASRLRQTWNHAWSLASKKRSNSCNNKARGEMGGV